MSRMTILLRGGCFLVCLLQFACQPSITARIANKAVVASTKPLVVEHFLAERNARFSEEELPELTKCFGAEFSASFQSLFYVEAHNYKKPKSKAWLVGYSLGDAPPPSLGQIYRTVLINSQGVVLLKLDDEIAGDEAAIFNYTDDLQAAAIVRYGGRPYTGKVTVLTIEPKPHVLLNYVPESKASCCESNFYLFPSDKKRSAYIGVQRLVMDFQAGKKWNEYWLYRAGSKSDSFNNVERTSRSAWQKLVKERHKQSPDLVLSAPPYDGALFDKLVMTDD